MMNESNIFGCFASTSLGDEQGALFRTYIWGEKGISETLKKLRYENYGIDMKRILFQFYVNPIPYELQNIKEIEAYRKREKSIGIPIVINDENFFSKSEEGRFSFLKQSILLKLVLLAEVVNKKKLDTNVEKLKTDLLNIL